MMKMLATVTYHCDPTHIHGLLEITGSMTYNIFTEQGNSHFRRRDPCKEIQNPNEVYVALKIVPTSNNNWNNYSEFISMMSYRGIDAPELKMPYGMEAKKELIKLIGGKSVTIYVYEQDQFGRYVGDIYCDNMFIQVKQKLLSSLCLLILLLWFLISIIVCL